MREISLKDVNKAYGPLKALRNITLDISKGEVVGIIGPNGAGKTTLVHLLLGLLKPSSGELMVAGFAPFKREVAFRRSTAFLMDEAIYWDNLTIKEHFSLLSVFYENLRGDGWMAPVKLWDLDEHVNKRICELSKGIKKRLGLACTFGRDCQVLILDEPFGDLDLASQKILQVSLVDAKRNGNTILITFHDPWQVKKIIDRLIILDRGTIVADEAMSSEAIRHIDENQLEDYIRGELAKHAKANRIDES